MAKKSKDTTIEEKEIDTLADKSFFKSTIAGLSIHLSNDEDRSQVGVDAVRFVPHKAKNEEGEDVRFGLLATDDTGAIEVLDGARSVVAIDREEYEKLLEKSTRVPY
ncbi:hypothetical protein [uncultured Kiloniella sp.]|uniref:hypothetical protein n=1 Tax=uncultured Kiloniella sp. TaxID=1133091 RepID=UPI00260F3DE7|nr:hypothetical protein [uncultured Kiloniella sp.]